MFYRNITTYISAASLLIAVCYLIFNALIRPHPIPEIVSLQDVPRLFSNNLHEDQTSSVYRFTDETFIRGLVHRHRQSKDYITGIEDALGAAVCVLDFDNDGWDDLLFMTGSGNTRHFGSENWWTNRQINRLYKNINGQYFQDVTEKSGLLPGHQGYSCAAADLDNDGWVDLVIANKGTNQIYRNRGDGTFGLQDEALKDDPEAFSTSILIEDFNGDGRQDVLFGNYVFFSQDKNVFEKSSGFETKFSANFDAALYDAQPDDLYLNQGDMQFIRDRSHLIDDNSHGRTLSFLRAAHSREVYALNDRGSPSQLLLGKSNGSPRHTPISINARDATFLSSPMAPSSQHILIATDASRGGLLALTQTNDNRYSGERSWEYQLNTEASLYTSGWALLHYDLNNDGLNDIFVANGLNVTHPDSVKTTLGQPNTMLFAKAGVESPEFHRINPGFERVLSSRGASTFDFNNDGRLDIIVANNNDSPTLLANRGNTYKYWLGIRCIPQHQCESLDLEIGPVRYQKPFERKIHYMGQSSTGFIASLGQAQSVHLALKKNAKTIYQHKAISHGNYYQIDLNANELRSIKTNTELLKLSELEFTELLLWYIRKSDASNDVPAIIARAADSITNNKIRVLKAIQQAHARKFYPLADLWSRDPSKDVSLAAIAVLSVLEMEETVPTLIHLLQSQDRQISCAASRAFESYFWKDEAVIERKYWAISELTHQLVRQDDEIATCAIDALGETESIRALMPLMTLLDSENELLASKAARALGMLRQTAAIPALRNKLVGSNSPFVKAQALVALTRLKAEVTTQEIAANLHHSPFFANILLITLDKFDEGVSIKKGTLDSIKTASKPGLDFLRHLPEPQLYKLYNDLSETNSGKLSQQLLHLAATITKTSRTRSHNTLTQEQFEFLSSRITSVGSLVELFKLLNSHDQAAALKAFPEILADNSVLIEPQIINKLCLVKGTISALQTLCATLSKMDQLALRELSDLFKRHIQNGEYELVKQVFLSRHGIKQYSFAFGRILNDHSIDPISRHQLVMDIPLHHDLLPQLHEVFMSMEPSQQLALLDKLETELTAIELGSWLKKINSQKLIQAVRYRVNALQDLPPRLS